MRIAVFGATGGTGKEVVKQALEGSHTVTAFVRDPARLSIENEALRVVVGDVLDQQAVSDAARDQDAVVVALGTRDLKNRTLRSEGTANVVRGMQAHGVRRIVVVSAGGAGDSYGQLPLFMRLIVKTMLRNTYVDHEAQERHVCESGLDWAIVRPAQLTNGPRTGKYFTGLSDVKLKGGAVSRPDVAEFVLKQVTGDAYLGKAVTIA